MSEPPLSRVTPVTPPLTRTDASQLAEIAKYAILQEGSSEEFTEWSEQAFNPLAMARRFEALESKAKKKDKEEESSKSEKKLQKITQVERLDKASEQYQRRNPELQRRSLLLLRSRLSNEDNKDDVLRKVLEVYPDYSLADEALDFLLETTEGELAENVRLAKDDLNARFGREVRAGRNMGELARAFSAQGLGSPSGLRDIYRDITGNPREASQLFFELSDKFPYEKMKSVIDFLLNSLGTDLKSKGPSIERAELYRLMTESRTLQAILGVYRFFKSRLKLMQGAFKREGLLLSSRLSFEQLAKLFMKFLQERYPSIDKIKQLALLLGISEELAAQIIVFTQMRDAIRQVAPKLFRSDQHRQDVLMAFIETLEELEEIEEEEEEEKEKDK